MKCSECKWSQKSKSKVHDLYCKRFGVHCQDHLSGCIDGESKSNELKQSK